jgi:hypothetical protein
MACRQQRAPLPDPTPERAAASKLTPARDPEGAVCADVGTLRACWSVSHLGTILVVSRTVPEGASRSPMGWRCWGQGAERACVDRRASAPAFECEGSSCVQRHPRMPDDGEWVCADSAGTTV